MKYKLLYFIIATALISCADDELNGLSSQKTYGDPVPVTINLAVNSESNGIQSTRSDQYGITRGVIDPEEEAAEDNVTKVMNAWVLQFDGTGDDATLVGLPEYLKAPNEDGMKTLSPRLIPTVGDDVCTIVVLANTFNESFDFHTGTKLSEIKALVSSVNNKYDVFGYEKPLDIANTDLFPMLNGNVVCKVIPDESLTCRLKRNIARIIVDIRIKDEAVSLTSVKLRGVPLTNFYFTNYDDFDSYSANAQTQVGYADYDAMKKPDSEGGEDDNGYKKFSYTFYAPSNIKGANDNQNELYKNVYAPQGATYLYISATYPDGSSEDAPISYTFYLGANFTNDYNLKCNNSYHYVINIDSKGIQRSDPRIMDMGTVDFTHETELSNCYILNPPTVDGYARRFRIPVKRVDEFWGNNGYENIPNNVLGKSERWMIYPIWSDFDTNSTNEDNQKRPYFVISKKEGNGKEDYFEVEITRGLKGNIVLGLMRVDANGQPMTNFLWSWHLWITDYNPDVEIPNINNDKSSYEVTDFLYDVNDGHVCRLAGTAWKTGNYKNAVMMDRNIGALVPPTQNSDPHNVGLVYQYGRKDPFPSTEKFYYFKDNTGEQYSYSKVNTIASSKLTVEGDGYMLYLVQNPKTFVMSYDGKLNGGKYAPSANNTDIVWYDPNVTFSGQAYPTNGKSIFDPSPLGWKLITQEAMEEIVTKINNASTHNDNYIATTNCNNKTSRKGFPNYTLDPVTSANDYRGLVYWPNVEPWLEQVPSNLIYFPVSMIRKNDTGVLDCIEVSFWLPRITTNSNSNSNEFLVGKTHPAYSGRYPFTNSGDIRSLRW